jgi:multiple sugar transport system permease protein
MSRAIPLEAARKTPPFSLVSRRERREWAHGLFILPYLMVFVLMIVIPLGYGLGLSLTKSDLFGVEAWLGLANYVRLLRDSFFLETASNTAYFVLLTVPALTALGLGLALALNHQTRWAAILRAVFFSSMVLSVTVVTLIWRLVFIPDGGLLAVLSEAAGTAPTAYLNNPGLAMPAIAVTTIWWCIGLPMVLYLAALQQVPRELYEAATLDNAGRWQTLRSITLPSVRRTTLVVLVIEVILQFQLFGQVQLMTGGGPNNATRSIVLFIYETGWRQWELGYAAAAAQVLFAVIMAVAMIQYFAASRKDQY